MDKRIGLRSLLKSPKEPLDRERDRGRNVSFFDDVTIYLFDQVLPVCFTVNTLNDEFELKVIYMFVSLLQETPTNELSSSAPTSPGSVSVKSSKLDFHGELINISCP